METALIIVGLLACPLMMLAMGGVAWAAARSRGDRPSRLTEAARRASCIGHGGGARRGTEQHELAGAEANEDYEDAGRPTSAGKASADA